MGGEGSGRKPDVIAKLINQSKQPIITNNDTFTIPNYSGVKDFAKKTGTGKVNLTTDTSNAPSKAIPYGNNNSNGTLKFDATKFNYDDTTGRLVVGSLGTTNERINVFYMTLSDTTDNEAIHWGFRTLSDYSEAVSIDWGYRGLYDEYSNQVLNWEGGLMLGDYNAMQQNEGSIGWDYTNHVLKVFDGSNWINVSS